MRSVLVALVVVTLYYTGHTTASLLRQLTQNGQTIDTGQGNDGSLYEITYPIQVDEGGEPILFKSSSRRQKRSLNDISSGKNVVFKMDAFNEKFHLHLSPNLDFISPNYVSRTFAENSTWTNSTTQDAREYNFYSGVVNGVGYGSNAVFSLGVDGLMGMFIVNGDRYHVEPYKRNYNISYSNLSNQPHIIYKFNSSKNMESHCDIEDHDEDYKSNIGFSKGVKDTNFNTESYKMTRKHHRHKRSESIRRYVEVMVAADRKMLDYHGSDLERYVLTLMAMVTTIYLDPSIENSINITIVRVEIIDDTMGLEITSNAAKSLKNFCSWQRDHNYPEHHPQHHDTAVLLTRHNICRAPKKCDTLGLAELGTICDPARSCSIIEDNGISAAFTIAHELGHVFNLAHDDAKRCKPHIKGKYEDVQHHVMSPALDANTSPWTWSNCSAHFMTDFIDTGRAECLTDAPQYKKYTKLQLSNKGTMFATPGRIYKADTQCRLAFGNNSKTCPEMPPCKRLWCTANKPGVLKYCRTQHMPWVDGTTCGPRDWCQKGECVKISNLIPVDGGWGEWLPYGNCTRICGGGIKKSERKCDNPTPKNGGKYCIGKRMKYKSCNIQACPLSMGDFRAQQCSKFNHKMRISGSLSIWEPKYDGINMKDRCKLFCQMEGSKHQYYQLKEKVIDGTKCGRYTHDVCVNGKCRKAGCDNRLGTSIAYDKCGVCGGDGSTCRTITRYYNPKPHYGYNFVGIIPEGAMNVVVKQISHSGGKDDGNYLSMRDSKNQYLFNGDFVISMYNSKKTVLGGNVIEYSGSETQMEVVRAKKIAENITVWVLSVAELHEPNIEYSYTISIGHNHKYKWSLPSGRASKCNKLCKGQRIRHPVCVREFDSQIASEQRCEGLKKPADKIEDCNIHCTLNWKVVSLGECSVSCGEGLAKQESVCIQKMAKNEHIVDIKYCGDVHPKPEYEPCFKECVLPQWKYSDWTECSVSCGVGGKQKRYAKCVNEDGKDVSEKECESNQLVLERPCLESIICPEWRADDWTGCSETCGGGYQYRNVWCYRGPSEIPVNTRECKGVERPPLKRICKNAPCRRWLPGGWGPCSASCGYGEKMRSVRCKSDDGSFLDDDECDAATKPIAQESCYQRDCPVTTTVPPTTTTTVASTTTTTTTVTEAAGPVYTWRNGEWTPCSETCGDGKRMRAVICGDALGTQVDEEYCISQPRLKDTEDCNLPKCAKWETGEWEECSVSCGEGTQRRPVYCVSDVQYTEEKKCNESEKPLSEQSCELYPCPQLDIYKITSNNVVGTSTWKIAKWSACSSSCGEGYRHRQIVCEDENGSSEECDSSQRPKNTERCDSGPCPKWYYEEWTPCSVTCGRSGLKKRTVRCQYPSGEIAPESSCNVANKGSSIKFCHEGIKCDEKRTWQMGLWGKCSVTCGYGYRQREVLCIDEADSPRPSSECKGKKPRSTKTCNAGRCPRWFMGEWGGCSASCGTGYKKRKVECRKNERKVVDPKLCRSKGKPKPADSALCEGTSCSQYMWKTLPWTQCTKSCGHGTKTRDIICFHTVQRMQVNSSFCESYADKSRPRSRRRCNQFPCPYMWYADHWNQCSEKCGIGKQTRTVVCKEVTKEGWILPGERDGKCKRSEKPTSTAICNHGDCGGMFRWITGSWGQCSARCGWGKQRRKVACENRHGLRRSKRRCDKLYKPSNSRKCYNGPCYVSSCKQLRHKSRIRHDGDYRLLVRRRLIKIYCKNMKKSNPSEFISLQMGERENYALVYDKRLKRPATCPDKERVSVKYCKHCKKQQYREAGVTWYSKIRVDLSSLQVISNDMRFTVGRGKRIPYGQAGDCYSSNDCPRGGFSINLDGTGFSISHNTTWHLQGNRASQRIWREKTYKIVGQCGGYCGRCVPNSVSGIQLELIDQQASLGDFWVAKTYIKQHLLEEICKEANTAVPT